MTAKEISAYRSFQRTARPFPHQNFAIREYLSKLDSGTGLPLIDPTVSARNFIDILKWLDKSCFLCADEQKIKEHKSDGQTACRKPEIADDM
jgi:hypothetical protein